MDTTPIVELLPEVLELVFFGLGSLLLAGAGALIERFAVLTVLGGQLALGGWIACFGMIAFYFAYLLFTDKFYPTLASLA